MISILNLSSCNGTTVVVGKDCILEMKSECDLMKMYILFFFLLPTLPRFFSKLLTLDFLLTPFCLMFPASDTVQRILYKVTGNIQGPEERRNYFNDFSLYLELVIGHILS